MEWRITRFPILASTNDLALEWIRAGRAAAGDVLVTAEQTSGRGRRGREWVSPRGALLCTVVLPFRVERGGWTALAAGLAVAGAVRELGAPAGVKWPNDVTLHGRKLAGILVEAPVPHLAAVGIGLNVRNELPPPEVAAAARLADTLPEVTVEAALEAVLSSLGRWWPHLLAADPALLRRAWAALDTTAGRRVRWSETTARGSTEGTTEGTAEGVQADGALRLRTSDGRRVTAAVGEVEFLD